MRLTEPRSLSNQIRPITSPYQTATCNGCLAGVDNSGAGGVVVVAGCQCFFGVTEYAAEARFRGGLQQGINFCTGDLLFQLHREVDCGHIDGGYAHDLDFKFAGHLGQHALDATGEAGVHKHDGRNSGSSFAKIGVMVGIAHRLLVHRGVDGGDNAGFDSEGAFQCRNDGDAAAGCAGGSKVFTNKPEGKIEML